MDSYSHDHFPEAVTVIKKLREKGHEAYFAGGYFRDRFLGRRPNDVDIATSAVPEQVRGAFTRTIPVGEQFGIIVVQIGQHRVEVATFRTDGGYEDGRRPTSVSFTSAKADAQRRDFTINGIFWDPITSEFHDFVGGREDLVRGLVRAIGDPDARFDEDKLRIMRAPRFAARLGFSLDKKTHDAAKRRAGEVAVVSAERIREELEKMLEDPSRSRAIELLEDLALLPIVLGEIDPAKLARGRAVLDELPKRKIPRALAWAALLIELDADRIETLLARLRTSNDERTEVHALVRDRRHVLAPGEQRLSDQKRVLLRQDANHLIELARAEALATTGDLEGVRAAIARRHAFEEERGPSAFASPRILQGEDLKKRGLKPGPSFRDLIDFAELARLEGRARDADEAIALIKAERPELLR